jgi:Holliday junction DNA helicase RuvA
MLSALKPDEIGRAILMGNSRVLESIKGIGKKTAERIVLELKDKLGKADAASINSAFINNTLEQDALNALIALGINRSLAQNAVKKAQNADPTNENLEVLIKKALQSI